MVHIVSVLKLVSKQPQEFVLHCLFCHVVALVIIFQARFSVVIFTSSVLMQKIFLEVTTDSLFCLCFSVRVSRSIIDDHHAIILLYVSVRWISLSAGFTSSA